MKRLLRLPRLTAFTFVLYLTVGAIVISDTGCGPKPACGTKRDHRRRKKRVHQFAPTMGMNNPSLSKNEKISFC